MASRPDKTLPSVRFRELIAESDHFGLPMRIWATAPRSYFASDSDHRRWNARFAGKPIAENPGAFRVRVIETRRGKRRWHVEIAVGAQRFSLSGHDEREAAEWDAGLFGSLSDLDAFRAKGDILDAASRLARLYVTAMKPKRAKR